jgi:SAM-dependent methyltransferase
MDPEALGSARRRGAGDLHVVLADGRGALPFPDASFDGVLMCHTLEHFSEGERPTVLGEVRRVLRGGGRLVVVVPNDGVSYHNFLYLDRRLARDDPDHKSFFTPRALREALQPHFRVEELFTYPAPFVWLVDRDLARRLSLGLGYNIYALGSPVPLQDKGGRYKP